MVKLDENNKIATRESFGKKIAEIGKKNKKIVVLDSSKNSKYLDNVSKDLCSDKLNKSFLYISSSISAKSKLSINPNIFVLANL